MTSKPAPRRSTPPSRTHPVSATPNSHTWTSNHAPQPPRGHHQRLAHFPHPHPAPRYLDSYCLNAILVNSLPFTKPQ
ncbi:hypothetical protein BDW22DRAFT_1364302 [Trametopsis cervina]|nr:hypothetical protein BDW22DRAFT_1364302 [Trametopsis cervina]